MEKIKNKIINKVITDCDKYYAENQQGIIQQASEKDWGYNIWAETKDESEPSSWRVVEEQCTTIDDLWAESDIF